MFAARALKRLTPKEPVLPVTRLVSTLSMTVHNGQLVARPLVLATSAAS